MAGLLAARILADRFADVMIIERDQLPTEPVVRRGMPQGAHPHALLEAERATLEDLFPRYGKDLVSSGGVVVDFASDVNFYSEGDFLAHDQTPMETYSATRPLIEQIARQHVSNLDWVYIRSGCQVTDYLLDNTATAVEGVVIREGADETEITADLIVDATGRTSRTPTWLENHGYTPPDVDKVRIDESTALPLSSGLPTTYERFSSRRSHRTHAVAWLRPSNETAG